MVQLNESLSRRITQSLKPCPLEFGDCHQKRRLSAEIGDTRRFGGLSPSVDRALDSVSLMP